MNNRAEHMDDLVNPGHVRYIDGVLMKRLKKDISDKFLNWVAVTYLAESEVVSEWFQEQGLPPSTVAWSITGALLGSDARPRERSFWIDVVSEMEQASLETDSAWFEAKSVELHLALGFEVVAKAGSWIYFEELEVPEWLNWVIKDVCHSDKKLHGLFDEFENQHFCEEIWGDRLVRAFNRAIDASANLRETLEEVKFEYQSAAYSSVSPEEFVPPYGDL